MTVAAPFPFYRQSRGAAGNKPTGPIRVEATGYFLKRYREDMVRNKQKAKTIEAQLQEFEARLRRQMLRDKLDSLAGAFETGAMPQIHVSMGQLAASRPAEQYATVSGIERTADNNLPVFA